MPVPQPHKGEKEDDFMERCMHEVSSNPDRTNDQNVAICKDAWRKGPPKQNESDKSESVYPAPICKMNAFKTLAEARGAYDQLAQQLAEAETKTARMAELEAKLIKSEAQRETDKLAYEDLTGKIEQKDSEISSLTGEIEALKTDNSALRTQLETVQKEQKTAKIYARELVAASGGTPVAVDQAEINRMQAGDEKEFVAGMLKEHDPVRLNQLYAEYNKLYRANGKHKKN